jgi:hypothetical protein
MTDNQWGNIVKFVLDRLKKAPSFIIERKVFMEMFRLDSSFDLEMLERGDYPAKKLFNRQISSRSADDSIVMITFSLL